MKQTNQKTEIKVTKGYKVTNADFACNGMTYELGKVFKHDGEIQICSSGFHFCEQANDCFNYYTFTSTNRVFEVEGYGELQTRDDKHCCGEIKFIRELTWIEVLSLVNMGKDNTGRMNTGDSNTGDSNTGDSNTGDRNTGDWNTGDRNTGYRNTGDRNTGDSNTGDRNTGYSNTGDRNTGVFCTGAPVHIMLFNKQSDWTIEQFEKSNAFNLLRNNVDTKMWVYESSMTDKEKELFPSYRTAGGYLKDIPFKEAFSNAWHNWSAENRKAFTSLPNFDKNIFEEITSVKVK